MWHAIIERNLASDTDSWYYFFYYFIAKFVNDLTVSRKTHSPLWGTWNYLSGLFRTCEEVGTAFLGRSETCHVPKCLLRSIFALWDWAILFQIHTLPVKDLGNFFSTQEDVFQVDLLDKQLCF